jgi:hypothetical protein
MAKQKFQNVDPQALDAFRRMVAGVEGVEMKGAAAPYTSINGNMYSAMSKASRIGLRLPKKELEAFIAKHDTELFEPFPGFRQKTYVAVPLSMHSNTRALRKYFRMAYEYVAGLKPKPATKGKK